MQEELGMVLATLSAGLVGILSLALIVGLIAAIL
jgi:hypothetical protein